MTTDITKINTRKWQHKRNTLGEIIQGTDDIRQCIQTILQVVKGSIPFMPELGTDIIEAIGENTEDAIDIGIAIITKEIPLQEPRAEVLDVTGDKEENGTTHFVIYFKDKTTNLTDTTEVWV